jgi:alpha-beta hydrolase superfamily lysophospholipase
MLCIIVVFVFASFNCANRVPASEVVSTHTDQPLPAAKPTDPPDLTQMSSSELKQYANKNYWADDYELAAKAIDALLVRANCSSKYLDHECLEIYMNKAVCSMQDKKLGEARSTFERLLDFAQREGADNNGGMDEPDCLFFLAECDYRDGAYKRAESFYKMALQKYRKVSSPLSADLSPCLDGLAGCLFRSDKYREALPLFTELAKIDVLNYGPDDLATAWSLLNLSDVLRCLNRSDEASQLFEKAVYTFRQRNADRILAKYQPSLPPGLSLASMQSKVRSCVFGNSDGEGAAAGGTAFAELVRNVDFSRKPEQRPFDFYNWRLKRTKLTEGPGLVTMDPTKPQKGLIICIHGLGLHHGTYQAFAEAMASRGFSVVAFDVRGFGSYRQNKGYDRVDLNGCVEDIANVLKLLRRDYPDRSMFLLGESMGGAIALQVAALHGQLIDGLVCSVPSGSRFDATKTNVNVAMKLLANKNKPFDIGKQVVAQATRNESLRRQWENDPEARLTLSASELLRFQKFMNQNLKAAEALKNLPVVIFQGYGDKLVKPDGTLALYNAIRTEDKDLIFVGHSEHLIFEEGQFKPSVINGLEGWLCSHLKPNESLTEQSPRQ